MADIAGREGLLVDIDTGTVRKDHVLVQHTPGALVFLGFGPRAERLRRFAFDDQGDAPFIARCRDVARAAESGRLVKARQAGISYAVLDIEDRVLRRFLIAESLAKAGYDPDEPRDDHGRWTGGGGGGGGASASAAGARPVVGVAAGDTAVVGSAARGLESLAGRAAALFDSLAPASTLSSLAAIGARLSAPAAFLSIILIPTNSNLAEDGTLPDRPDVAYHFDRDTGTLTLTQGGDTIYFGHPDRDSLFLDKDGRPIGRELDGSLVLNSKAIAARAPRSAVRARASAKADTDRDEPEICPDPSKDRRPDKKRIRIRIRIWPQPIRRRLVSWLIRDDLSRHELARMEWPCDCRGPASITLPIRPTKMIGSISMSAVSPTAP